jgi:heat shock protein HslJ
LERLDGRDVISHSKASLIVSVEGRMSGNGSCNAMFGHSKIEGHSMVFEMIGSTKMACVDPDVSGQEHRYFDALHQVASWRVQDDRLYLTDRAHVDVLVYEAE